jgi:BirA family biotin operon repressor/biotin-[acetyl-CoA-carboxylase] ligase
MTDAAPIDVAALRTALVDPGVLASVEHHETIASTNLRAAELGREGAAALALVLAEHQSAGRGRQGRVWESPARRNFYGSLLLRPELAPASVPPITLVAAVAVTDSIRACGVAGAGIKWPNDVLFAGRKVAGVLTEMEAGPAGVAFVVVGIGVNLNLQPEEIAPELVGRATSLAIESGRPVDRTRFAESLAVAFERRLAMFLRGGFAALRADYEALHILQGRDVEAQGGVSLRGRVVGVDDTGALLLETAQGREAVHAGEVTLTGSYDTLFRAG